MDQNPYQVASYVHECLEQRRYAEVELVPYFSVEEYRVEVWGRGVWDTFSQLILFRIAMEIHLLLVIVMGLSPMGPFLVPQSGGAPL